MPPSPPTSPDARSWSASAAASSKDSTRPTRLGAAHSPGRRRSLLVTGVRVIGERMQKLLALAALAFILLAEAPAPAHAAAGGAFATGRYRNLFAEADPHAGEAEVRARLDAYWASLFGADPERRVYYSAAPNANGPSAYIHD